jgi:biotin carboxylase
LVYEIEKEAKWAAIVDAYSSGNLLAPEFRRRGLQCFHIQSAPNIPAPAQSSFHPECFAAKIIHSGEIDRTLEACRQFSLQCLIAGSETGVELADQLSERLGLFSNGTSLSASRRDKFEMLNQVRNSGLRTIPSLKTSDSREALDWINEATAWPVVIKPLRSAGSDSVTTCTSRGELLKVFDSTLGKRDQFGSRIEELLVQKKMEGREYIIDAVSSDGLHHMTNVWQIVKGVHNNGDFVCDYNQLLPYEEATRNDLLEYTLGVITALGIKHGPTHTELLLTKEGPVLVEIASRLHGAGFPIYSRECVGYSQVDLTVDAYVDANAFRVKSRTPYQLTKHLLIVELISAVEGRIKALNTKHIEDLPSFYSMKLDMEPGALISKTIDVFTSPGHVVLIHDDLATVWRDYIQIRRLEGKGLFYQV